MPNHCQAALEKRVSGVVCSESPCRSLVKQNRVYKKYLRRSCLIALVACLGWSSSHADDEALQIKSAFVLNFLKYTDWSPEKLASEESPLVLAIVGEGRIAAVMREVVSGSVVHKRKVAVKIYRDAEEFKSDGASCHAVFVTPAAMSAWEGLRPVLLDRGVLAIAASPGFCAAGGALNLVEKESRMRFEANPGAARVLGVRLRSDLLKLAVIVKSDGKVKQ